LKNVSYILIILIPFILFSCKQESKKKSEGTITYKVSYPKMGKDNFMLDFMPKKMTMKFREDKYITNLSAGFGMFKTNFICDKDANKFSQLVKLIDKKYILDLEGEAIQESINKLPKFNVEFTSDTKKILGYKCKKAIVKIENNEQESFTVFYTNDINIETPNWCNQFQEIDAVLLEYQYEKYDITMRFEATEIKFEKLQDSEFEVSTDYELISETDMNKEMQEIFDSFH